MPPRLIVRSMRNGPTCSIILSSVLVFRGPVLRDQDRPWLRRIWIAEALHHEKSAVLEQIEASIEVEPIRLGPEQLLRLENHFGLTPAARARLEAPQQPESATDDKRNYLKLG